jgi:hypothetical protein
MVYIQWVKSATPLARNIARKVLLENYSNKIKELEAKGIPPPPKTKTKEESKVVDGEFSMKTRAIFEAGVQLQEGSIDPPPFNGGQYLKQHDPIKNPAPPAPSHPGHVFRSMQ